MPQFPYNTNNKQCLPPVPLPASHYMVYLPPLFLHKGKGLTMKMHWHRYTFTKVSFFTNKRFSKKDCLECHYCLSTIIFIITVIIIIIIIIIIVIMIIILIIIIDMIFIIIIIINIIITIWSIII